MIRPLLIAFLVSTSATAFAQGAATDPTPEDKSQAKRLVGEAQQAFNDGDFEVCAQKFSTAFKLAPLPQIQFNLALCYERQERYRDASIEYEAAAKHKDMPAEMRAKANESLKKMRSQMAKIRIEGADGEGLVDDKIKCELPCTLYLEPGSHVIRFGEDNKTKSFNAVRERDAVVSLKPDMAKVEETNTDFDATEPAENARPDLTSEAGSTSASSGDKGVGLLTWGGAGLAAAGTTGALVFGLKTRSLHDDFSMMPTRSLADDGNQARTFTNLSIGIGVVGMSMVVYDLLID
jgi:hypothetical protein